MPGRYDRDTRRLCSGVQLSGILSLLFACPIFSDLPVYSSPNSLPILTRIMLIPPHILDIWPGTIHLILLFLTFLVLLLWALRTTAIHSKTPSRTPSAALGAWPVLGSLEFFTKRCQYRTPTWCL
jgi:hypothetical protein